MFILKFFVRLIDIIKIIVIILNIVVNKFVSMFQIIFWDGVFFVECRFVSLISLTVRFRLLKFWRWFCILIKLTLNLWILMILVLLLGFLSIFAFLTLSFSLRLNDLIISRSLRLWFWLFRALFVQGRPFINWPINILLVKIFLIVSIH